MSYLSALAGCCTAAPRGRLGRRGALQQLAGSASAGCCRAAAPAVPPRRAPRQSTRAPCGGEPARLPAPPGYRTSERRGRAGGGWHSGPSGSRQAAAAEAGAEAGAGARCGSSPGAIPRAARLVDCAADPARSSESFLLAVEVGWSLGLPLCLVYFSDRRPAGGCIGDERDAGRAGLRRLPGPGAGRGG